MLIKIHKGTRYVVAICDSNLIENVFEEGEKQIDLTGNFFKGDEKTKKEVKEIIRNMKIEDACFNIVGKKSVKLGIELGLIKKDGIIRIQDVPVSLVLV